MPWVPQAEPESDPTCGPADRELGREQSSGLGALPATSLLYTSSERVLWPWAGLVRHSGWGTPARYTQSLGFGFYIKSQTRL